MTAGSVALITGILLLIVLLGWSLSWTATRLDRLHNRVESARASLDAQLVRRASVALELATADLLDPASSVLLADAAHEARESGGPERERSESLLTQALVAALDAEAVALARADVLGEELLRELDSACYRVTLARRFYNDAVRGVHMLRATRTVRWFGLAGNADMPTGFEFDDTRPPTLTPA